MKKFLVFFLAALMLLSVLAGCKDKAAAPGTAATEGDGTTSTAPTDENGNVIYGPVESKGSLILNCNAVVKITYDKEGLVQLLEPMNDTAIDIMENYNDQSGFTCVEVITKIVKDSVAKSMGQLSAVVVKQNKGSGNPTEGFLQNIESEVKTALTNAESSAKLLMVGTGDLDAGGYIKLKDAKTLVAAYLGAQLDSIYGTDAPANGFYSFTVTYGGMEAEVHVNAETGAVGDGLLEMEENADNDPAEATDPKEPLVTDPTQPSESAPAAQG